MTFSGNLLAALDGGGDISLRIYRLYHYDFDGVPVRLWAGQGRLFVGGQEWLGTVDERGTDRHQAQTVQTPRDGTSPRYTFGLPYIDKATYNALKADKSLAMGRAMTSWYCLVLDGEGLRPSTPLRFAYRLTIQEVEFGDARQGDPANSQRAYSASVLMRTDEVGRSREPRGTYTDTSQRERARLMGVASDSFCGMVARNSRRTITIEN